MPEAGRTNGRSEQCCWPKAASWPLPPPPFDLSCNCILCTAAITSRQLDGEFVEGVACRLLLRCIFSLWLELTPGV
jgi:hypothetical protein